ncbi:pyridoxal phosphate-dependent aminotransferase [Bacillus sp. 1P06AnD]|uniref:pyridoxal phosphate-dependent aminotransferase n=1 Tax=Bacillus sp. 1P06AnD TaxID=3132208 RepID=UPI0039A32210
MQHSQRLQQLPSQFFSSLVQKVNKAINEGRDIINLGQGNPDQPTPTAIIEELYASAKKPKNHGYSPFRGLISFKDAICQFYKREYNVDLDRDKEVAILFGGKSGLVQLPLCFCNEGDVVLAPDPGYPDYLSGIALAKAAPFFMPLEQKNNYLPDYSLIPKHIADKAKLVFLNYPNNPTGACSTDSFFQDTVTFARENEIGVIHDFAYGAIGYDGNKPLSFLQSDGAKDVGIEIYTLSKTFNMAGWRVGFAVGNEQMIEAINLLQDHLYVSLFPAIQDAAAKALLECREEVIELVGLYEKRRNTFIESCRKIGWEGHSPEGSFFVWMPVPEGFTSEAFSDRLLELADVAVAPGIGFGPCGEGYVRIGLVEPEERLLEAVARIGKSRLLKKK